MANGHGGKRPGAGGKKGVPRTKTKQAYEAIEMAFEGIGGVKALIAWAEDNRSDFYKTIFPKIIPVQLTGEGGGPIEFSGIQRAIVKANPPSDR